MPRFESLNICSGVDEARILPLLNSNHHIALFTIHQVKGVFRSLLTFTSILLNIFICWSKPVWLCSAGIMPFFDLTNVHNYIVYNLASKELELVFEPIVSISFFKRDFFCPQDMIGLLRSNLGIFSIAKVWCCLGF